MISVGAVLDAVLVHVLLREALEPALRDVVATGAPMPDVRDDDWAADADTASAMLWSRDGSGAGIQVRMSAPEPDRVAQVADQVQEFVIEELARLGATNWPVCPRHPTTHPMEAASEDGVAVWVCPADAIPVSSIGTLTST